MAFSHLMACNNKSEPFVVCNNFWLYLICAHIAHKCIEAILFGRCWVTQCFLLIVHNFTAHVCVWTFVLRPSIIYVKCE